MIRTGPDTGNCRRIFLVDRIGLLLLSENSLSPLEQLAILPHPVQGQRAKQPELLHSSSKDDKEGKFSGRLSKRLLAEAIEYAKSQDEDYEKRLPGWIEDYETAQAESAAQEKKARYRRAQVIRRIRNLFGRPLHKTLNASLGIGSFSVKIHENIRVNATLLLNEDQLYRYMKLISSFEKESNSGV